MSKENVEVVKRVYEAFNSRDWDAVFRDMHPDFEMTTKRGPSAGTHRSREAAQGFAEDYLAAFDDATADPERFLESGDRVLVLVTRRAKPKGGEMEMEMEVRNGHLWTLRDGRILSMESFPNPDEALEVAGLSEQAMPKENAEIVRRVYEQLNRGDVEGLTELCDDDFVMDMSERVFNPDIYRGHDGIRRFYAGVTDTWESWHWDVEETHVAGDSVVAMLHCQGQSRESGPGVDWRVAWIWKFRRDRPVSLRFYRDRAKALEAAGLSE